ncbi:MAG: transglutaminase-like domain-containing protein [Candidatus Woesearchaeota archaeon]
MEEDLIPEPEPWYKGPMKYILGIMLIFMLVLWFIPVYSIKLDPNPTVIPKLEDVVGDIEVDEKHHNQISMLMIDGVGVKEVADKIVVRACRESNKICDAKAIFYFVRDNFEYVSDPTAYEYVKTAKQSLVVGGGDCDDASVLLASLLDAVGIRSRFVFIPGHVYVQAYLPDALKRYREGDYVNLDAACSNCDFGEISWKSFDKEERILG